MSVLFTTASFNLAFSSVTQKGCPVVSIWISAVGAAAVNSLISSFQVEIYPPYKGWRKLE
jgi:hypothetical protein